MTTMRDIKSALGGMMHELAGQSSGEQLQQQVARAKAMADIAGAYIAASKAEIDAVKVADELGLMDGLDGKERGAKLLGVE